MPEMISLVLEMRPNILVIFSPTRPHQLELRATLMVGWARMAGVHSTVWILAMRAVLTRRAVSKS